MKMDTCVLLASATGSSRVFLGPGTACTVHAAVARHVFAVQVASVYDLAVHPAVQQQGIGQRLLQLLVHQLQMQGIYDIGEATCWHAADDGYLASTQEYAACSHLVWCLCSSQ